jgi:protein tyrosine phosphatase (PTP) superfamily phosphohydrolase (DUF442 family)
LAGFIALTQISFWFSVEATAVFAQNSRERVRGVANFGRVTPTYFRGGEVTPEGLKNLASMGVRTVIDLREEADEKEKKACEQLGITYYSFPMTTEDTPDPAKIEKVVQIIREAKSPVYVHCSGGKHRTGTTCAYFRIRDQGWSAEKAWREQQAYGFGPPEEHANLFLFIYGDTPVGKKLMTAPPLASSEKATALPENGDAKPATATGEPKRVADSAPSSTVPASLPGKGGSPSAENIAHPQGILSTTASYIAVSQAIELVRGYGGTGEAIRINLEYDKKLTVPVWKILLATGTEYRLNALTGRLLGTKMKSDKLSFLSPLDLKRRYWTFQKVIAKAEQRGREKVTEMELKTIRGRNVTFFEVMMADGVTLFFDAASGHQIRAF